MAYFGTCAIITFNEGKNGLLAMKCCSLAQMPIPRLCFLGAQWGRCLQHLASLFRHTQTCGGWAFGLGGHYLRTPAPPSILSLFEVQLLWKFHCSMSTVCTFQKYIQKFKKKVGGAYNLCFSKCSDFSVTPGKWGKGKEKKRNCDNKRNRNFLLFAYYSHFFAN